MLLADWNGDWEIVDSLLVLLLRRVLFAICAPVHRHVIVFLLYRFELRSNSQTQLLTRCVCEYRHSFLHTVIHTVSSIVATRYLIHWASYALCLIVATRHYSDRNHKRSSSTQQYHSFHFFLPREIVCAVELRKGSKSVASTIGIREWVVGSSGHLCEW